MTLNSSIQKTGFDKKLIGLNQQWTKVITIGSVFLVSQFAWATDNWPQWRGPGWSNVSSENAIPIEFGPEKNLLWRTKMPGPGGSSPVVWDDLVFVTSADDDKLVLLALNTSGEVQWTQQLEGKNKTIQMDRANYASPSPMTDGEHVWATSGAGVIHCFTMDGQPVWKKDLQADYGTFNIQFGMTSTPILDKGRLYLQLIHGDMRTADPSIGWVIALESKNGNEIWKYKRETEATHENKHAYTSPIIYRDEKQEFLITHGGDYAMGHSLEDGHELWRLGGLNDKSDYNPYLRFVSSPTCVRGMIVVPSAKSGPVVCIKPPLSGDVTAQTKVIQWKLDRGTPDVASPLIDSKRGLVYLCRENGVLLALNARSGEEVFNERLFADKHRSTPVLVGDHFIVAARNGDILVFECGDVPKLLATNKLGEETTASPAIANGRIFIRTYDALYAFGSNTTVSNK